MKKAVKILNGYILKELELIDRIKNKDLINELKDTINEVKKTIQILEKFDNIKPDCHFYDDDKKKWIWAYSVDLINKI